MSHPNQYTADLISVVAFVSTFLGWVPPLVAFIGSCLGVAWYAHLFYKEYFKNKN